MIKMIVILYNETMLKWPKSTGQRRHGANSFHQNNIFSLISTAITVHFLCRMTIYEIPKKMHGGIKFCARLFAKRLFAQNLYISEFSSHLMIFSTITI